MWVASEAVGHGKRLQSHPNLDNTIILLYYVAYTDTHHRGVARILSKGGLTVRAKHFCFDHAH